MSVFSVPVTIGVDEEAIVKEIQENVESQVVTAITKEIKSVIYNRRNYGSRETNEPLREMIKDRIDSILEENKDLIIKEAGDRLADKLLRTKAVKEATKDIIEKVKKGE